MDNRQVSEFLWDYYQMLQRYLVGKRVKSIIRCTESNVALLMDDGTIIDFSHLEEELFFDICLPVYKQAATE